MQLLKITSTPMKYELEIERSKLQMKQPQPTVSRRTTPGTMKMQSKNIAVKLDTVETRQSMGLKSTAASMAESAQLGVQAVANKTTEYAEIGYQMSQVQNNRSISDIAGQFFYPSLPMIESKFSPHIGPNISWDSNTLSMEYSPSSITNDWNVMRNTMEYIPGKIAMNISQYPSISIEYVGEPIYVPASANPNYEE